MTPPVWGLEEKGGGGGGAKGHPHQGCDLGQILAKNGGLSVSKTP